MSLGTDAILSGDGLQVCAFHPFALITIIIIIIIIMIIIIIIIMWDLFSFQWSGHCFRREIERPSS